MGDGKSGARAVRAGAKRGTIRRRAVGTRDRIISHLAMVEEISDAAGMASTRLAEAVGYPGSSVAFAQLLSGMERDGLLLREVRGKRTYRIALPEGVAAGRLAARQPSVPEAVTAIPDVIPGAAAVPGFDYDELARRLLVQVIRRLSASSAGASADVDGVDAAGAVEEHSDGQPAAGLEAVAIAALAETEALRQTESQRQSESQRQAAALQETVAGLERELATAWTRHGSLTAENARLREQLQEAQRDLALERSRKAAVAGELNQAEVVLLERLLSATPQSEEESTAS